jgi:hypothetical protein
MVRQTARSEREGKDPLHSNSSSSSKPLGNRNMRVIYVQGLAPRRSVDQQERRMSPASAGLPLPDNPPLPEDLPDLLLLVDGEPLPVGDPLLEGESNSS